MRLVRTRAQFILQQCVRRVKQMNYFEEDISQTNPYLKGAVLEAVENQLRDRTPPEAAEALERLKAGGYSENRAKERIAAVLVEHMYTVLRDQIPFDNASYVRDLKKIE